MGPILENALRHPIPRVRRRAASLLEKIDPDRLRRVAEELNHHQASLFQDHLKLLASSNYRDRVNAIEAIQFMGPQATSAIPLLAQTIFLGKVLPSYASTGADVVGALRALREIGPGAASVTPILIRLFQTNDGVARVAFETLSSFGADAASAVPALRAFMATHADSLHVQAAQALVSIDPHDSNAIAILREDATPGRTHYWLGRRLPSFSATRLSSSVSLWKLGLETNLPMDQLVAHATNYDPTANDLLGDIGPQARRALPSLEQRLDPLNPQLDVAIAIRKIDPEEAKRLGLPGLLIICPDRY
jgi:hypothetical protein